MSPPKDPIKYEQWKKNMSKSHKESLAVISLCRKNSAAQKNKPLSESHRNKIRTGVKNSPAAIRQRAELHAYLRSENSPCIGRVASDKTRLNMSISHKNSPQCQEHLIELHENNKNRPKSEETINALICSMKESPAVAEHLKELNSRQKGENHPQWKGGISFEPYCPKFNEEFKERVRGFFGRKCFICGKEETREKHHVHHVNYDKMVCCNDTKPLFVPLCRSCHSKTSNGDREKWASYLTDQIMIRTGGACFAPNREAQNATV